MKNLMSMLSLVVILAGAGIVEFPLIQSAVASAATTFTNTTIEAIEGANLTVHTRDGNAWTFQISDTELTKGLHKGDHVSLELNAQGQVMKIVKIAS